MPAFFGEKLAWIALDFGNRFWDYPGPGTALREPAFLLQGIQPVVNAAEIIEVFPMVSRSNSYYSVIIVVLLTGAAAGQEESKPWWNPFSTTSPSRRQRSQQLFFRRFGEEK